MKQVEINTSQNVKIEYQLASIGQRGLAFAIDSFVLIVAFLIFYFFSQAFNLYNNPIVDYFFTCLIVILLWFYTLISEVVGNGQTIGKLALGIKVVKLNGDEMEFYDYFTRWSVRLFDIYMSMGAIAMLLIASNKAGQRLGDIIAGTTVIKKRSSYGFRLNDILRLNENKKEEYAFEYPNARLLTEKDVILIKNTVYRFKQFSNTAHNKALDLMVTRVYQTMGLEELYMNNDQKVRFLNKVVSEYIILTR